MKATTRLLAITASTAAALALAAGAASADHETWSGLQWPESVVHDTARDRYLVSNINGRAAAAKDNNGFIALLDPAGGAAERWIEGGRDGVELNAPKGMALTRELLWVTDIDRVRAFSRRSGRPVREIPIRGATFLNDIALGPRGELYVTDSGITPDASGALVPSGSDAIHRIDPGGRLRTIVAGRQLDQPNGVQLTRRGTLLVATRGADALMEIDRRGRITRRTVPARTVDGVLSLGHGDAVVSTWEQPGLWLLRDGRPAAPFLPGVELPGAVADFSLDRKRRRLLLPLLMLDQFRVLGLADRLGR